MKEKALDRQQKRTFVESLAKTFAETGIVLVTRNDGLTVADVTTLRQKVREASATYKVAKNRLVLRAASGSSYENITPLLKGPTALAWSDEPVGVSKALVEFAKDNEKLVILGGSIGSQALSVDDIKSLAELPSLDELRAKVLGMLNTPATRIAGVTQAPAGQLARVFGAYAKSAA